MAKAIPTSNSISVFKAGSTKVIGGPKPTERILPDGGSLSLTFDEPLLSFRPAKAAVAYREIKVAVRLKARPVALIVMPRFAVTRIAAAVLITMDTAGVRETVEIRDDPANPIYDWEPRYLLPSTLLTGMTVTLTIAFQAETFRETGEVQVSLNTIDLHAVKPSI